MLQSTNHDTSMLILWVLWVVSFQKLMTIHTQLPSAEHIYKNSLMLTMLPKENPFVGTIAIVGIVGNQLSKVADTCSNEPSMILGGWDEPQLQANTNSKFQFQISQKLLLLSKKHEKSPTVASTAKCGCLSTRGSPGPCTQQDQKQELLKR